MDPATQTPPAAVVPPVTPPAAPPPPTPAVVDPPADNVEGLKNQVKALLTEKSNLKTTLSATTEELAAMKAKESKAEEERLKASGDNEALFNKERAKNATMLDRIVLAELKAHAGQEGIIDLDAVALIPRDKIKIDDTTLVVSGVDTAVADFKAAKSIYFTDKVVAAAAAPVVPPVKPAATGAPVTPPAPAAPPSGVAGLKPGTKEAKAAIAAFNAKYQS